MASAPADVLRRPTPRRDPSKRASASEVLASAWVSPLVRALEGSSSAEAAPSEDPISKWSVLLGDKAPLTAPSGADSPSTRLSGAKLSGAKLDEGKQSGEKRPQPSSPVKNDGSFAKRRTVSTGGSTALADGCPYHLGRDYAEEVPSGVNGMLVRSLGWVQLPAEKEKMVGDVASALDSLGAWLPLPPLQPLCRARHPACGWALEAAAPPSLPPTPSYCLPPCCCVVLGVKYEVVKGELSDVVWVGPAPEARASDASGGLALPATTAAQTSAASCSTDTGGGVGDSAASTEQRAGEPAYSEGQLCVRLRVVPDGESASEIHIDRQAGDVLQFHSFYRDVRNQLAGVNGWVHTHGKYEHAVYSEYRDPED